MSTWESAADDWARARPHASPPSTWGEIAAAGAREGGLGTFFGAGAMQQEAYAELERRLYAETGQTAVEFTDRWGGRQSGDPIPLTDRAYLIGQNLGKLDKGRREAIAPLVDITGRAAAAAAKASEEDAAVFARTYGFGGNAVRYATYLGRQLLDPVNLATVAATGGEGGVANAILGITGKGLVATGGRLAVAGAEQAALAEPLAAAARENVGLPNAPYLEAVAGGALFNVGFAAGGHLLAAGVPALLRSAAAAGRWYRGRGIEPPLHPDDALAAADAVETQNVMTAQAHPATPAARATMPARIDRAGQALEGHGVKAEDPVAGGGADPTPAIARDLEHQAATGGPEGGAPTAPPDLGPHQVEIGGKRYAVTYKLVELRDLVVSHFMDGRPNPGYPQQAQPRDLSTPASQSLVNDAAAHYRPALALDPTESVQIGPPVVTPSMVTVIGNRRAQMLARVYDRHPEHADAYRAGLIARGYDATGMEFPMLVRELRDELTPAELQTVGREGNVSPTGKMAAGEQAFADAQALGNDLLDFHRAGPVTSLANVPFVQAFVDRLVAPTEREALISKSNVLSVEGVRRIEAALVAKAYEAPDIVAGLFEATEPSSRAILGAFADNAGKAARVKAEIAAGRIGPELDPSPPLVDAFRLVERARKSGQKVDLLAGQVDLELGAVPPATLDALDYYFRDPPKSKAAKEAGVAYRVAAGRVAIAPQIERAMDTALSKADAAGDLFGAKPDAGFALREGGTAEMPPGDLTAGEDLAAPAADWHPYTIDRPGQDVPEPVAFFERDAAEAAAHGLNAASEGGAPSKWEYRVVEGTGERPFSLERRPAAEGTAAPTPAEPALAGILPPEPVYPPPPAGTPPEAAAILEKARTPGPGSVPELLARKAGPDELGAHSDIVAAEAYAASHPLTTKLPGFGSPRFFRERVYKFGGRLVVGFDAAIDELVNVARAYSTRGPVRNERQAVIVIGPPAAGKSTISEEIAKDLYAAIPDPDDAKKVIDGYRGGSGANAVHLESSVMTTEPGGVTDRLVAEGANLVIPKVGDDAEALEKFIATLAAEGYTVKLVSVYVDPAEAYRRMIGRYLKTGRIINDEYFRGIGAKPSATYYIIKGKGLVDEATEIDGADRPAGEPRRIRDTAGPGLGKRPVDQPGSDRGLVRGADGGGPSGAPEGARGAARRVPEAGGRRDLAASEAGYTAQALANLKKTSRTAGGVIDTSSTAGKAEKMVAGLTPAEAAARATANFAAVIGDLYRIRGTLPTDAAGVLELLDRTAARINEGIVRPGEIDRTLDTKIASQTRVADLPAAKRQFAEELAARLADPAADPVETAAWIEWRANVIDHFWSDGTGKTSRALAAVPLMRAGLALPDYPVNKVTYAYAPTTAVDPAAGGPGYLGADWQRWNYFYHELMPERPAPAPAKPIGDPQLAAEADSVVADVGENFLIKLAEPGSDEVRTLSIAEARAEAAEVDAAAEELIACIAGAGGAAVAGGAAAAAAAP